jgi:2-oxoisovalerate dehydrogenase E1 component
MSSTIKVGTSKETLLGLYRTMQTIRQTEDELARCHQRGLIHGACHTYVGQEAVATGVCAHLSSDDVVFSTHRGHGHALAKGLPPRELAAELFGRATGCSRGRGGSMHLFAPEIGLMGTSGIVGPAILQAAGGGYGFKILKSDRVAVAFFGDGAVNNGAFHEGLNMAAIWNLPVLFICENNQYATEVPFSYSSGNPSVAGRAANYGLPGAEVDGNDVTAVFEAAREAVERARSGFGATLIECKTYRTRPHAEGMGDFGYRTRDEVDAWKARCPIARFRSILVNEGQAATAELDAIDSEVADVVREAIAFADSSPWPNASSAATHVYYEEPAAHAPRHPQSSAARSEPPQPTAAEKPGREATWMQACLEALTYEMEQNPAIFVMGEGIGKRGGNFRTTVGLFDRFGADRLCDTPICERGFVGLGGGAAMVGARPVIDFMFADFVLDSLGEILNQIAKMQYMSSGRIKMPILLRGCIGIGHSAATHHSGNYYPLYAQFPGLRVVVPSTAYDAKGLLHHALRSYDPVLFLEHRELLTTKSDVPEEPYEIEFGKATVVRPGDDVTVVSLASMAQRTLKVAQELAGDGISVELVDPRTVAPLDIETIRQSVAKTGRLLIVDEAFGPYGVGAEIAAQIADRGFDDLDAPIRRLNGLHTPTPYSPPLEAAVVPDAEQIARAIRDLVDE